MIKTRYERLQVGSAINFQSMYTSFSSFVCDWTFPLLPFLGENAWWAFDDDDDDDDDGDYYYYDDDDDDDDDADADADGEGDGDGDDVDSDGDNWQCWDMLRKHRCAVTDCFSKAIVQEKKCNMELVRICVTWSIPLWDHTFSGAYSDARSDTPRYPERYLKSIQLRKTTHDHFKLYNSFLFAHVNSF